MLAIIGSILLGGLMSQPAQQPMTPEKNAEAMQEFQGGWKATSCEMNGHKYDREETKRFVWDHFFNGDRYAIHFGAIRHC